MTYKELSYAIDLLQEEGYLEQRKPIWDTDLYNILNKVNKDLPKD